MRERRPGERLRVVIGGDIYAKRALVRWFLEDDGFDVVAEAIGRDQLLALPTLRSADAVIVDGDLLGRSVDELRALAADAAIVVFTRSTAPASPPGADAYLEKGMGLATLTALLHSLLTEPPPIPLTVGWAEPAPIAPPERRVLPALGGAAAAVVMVVVVALAVFGSGGVPVARNVADATSPPTPSVTPDVPTALQQAEDHLQELQAAILAGRSIEIGHVLDQLAADIAVLRQDGSIARFGATVSRLLQPLVGSLGADLLDRLGGVLGAFLDLPSTGASGSSSTGGVVLDGSTAGTITGGGSSTGSGGSSTSGGATGGSGGQDHTGSGGGSNDGGSNDGGSNDGGSNDGGGPTAAGNGHHYGWAHKPPQGGWHGNKPHGNDNANNHGKGNAKGHAKREKA
jgi:hypothetical protein